MEFRTPVTSQSRTCPFGRVLFSLLNERPPNHRIASTRLEPACFQMDVLSLRDSTRRHG